MIPAVARGTPVLVLGLALLLAGSAARGQVDAVFSNCLQANRACLNDGAGTFSCADVSSDTNATLGVALADLDGVDGIDLVFANDGEENRVCLNDGTGNFTCSNVGADTNASYAVALADLDGVDGIDAVFANFNQRNRACLNDGAGNFTCSDITTEDNLTEGVATEDLDGVDGIDVVFANLGGPNRVCLNDGAGSFTCSNVSDDGFDSYGVALGDVDGVDGIDAVFSNLEENRVCLNDGSGAFTCSDVSADLEDSSGVALGDLDGVDGIDAVFSNRSGANRVCLNDGSGAFTCSDVSADTDFTEGVALGDLDGVDGIDAVFANDAVFGNTGVNRVCLNDGSGTFTCSDVSADTNDSYAVALGSLRAVDLSISKTDEQTTAVPGETLTYVITVGNTGPTSAPATVSDAFPSALSCAWSCAGEDGTTCTAGPVAGDIADTVSIPVGGVATYFAVCTVDSGAAGTLLNTATVLPNGRFELDASDNSATDVDGLTPQADLAISKTDGQTTAVPGLPVTYLLGASNPGPSDVYGAQVSDPFSALLSCSWTCAASGGATCVSGPVAGDIADTVDLPAGGAVGYVAVCAVDPGATGALVNKAAVSAPAGVTDPDSTNDSAADFDLLTPMADLTITKDDGLAFVEPGDPVTYTIVVGNSGPSDALAASVADPFPAELIDCEWTCTPTGGALCTGGPVSGDLTDSVDLPVGSSATYAASCTVDPGALFSTLVNSATVTAPAGVTDPNPANNSATDTDAGPLIFTDGFEAGDTSAWSATVP